MKQLKSSMPLCYLLPNSQLITALPYIDQEYPQYRNKIQYLIKNQQQSMSAKGQEIQGQVQVSGQPGNVQQNNMNIMKYIEQLPMPITPLIDSEYFQREVDRIKVKLKLQKLKQQKTPQPSAQNPKKLKDKNTKSIFDEIDPKFMKFDDRKLSQQNKHKIQKAIITYQNNLVKQINLQIYQKLAPLIQKQCISALDKRKEVLLAAIQKERLAIQQLNKNRQYQQLQARQREQTIKERLKVMIHKKRKVQ